MGARPDTDGPPWAVVDSWFRFNVRFIWGGSFAPLGGEFGVLRRRWNALGPVETPGSGVRGRWRRGASSALRSATCTSQTVLCRVPVGADVKDEAQPAVTKRTGVRAMKRLNCDGVERRCQILVAYAKWTAWSAGSVVPDAGAQVPERLRPFLVRRAGDDILGVSEAAKRLEVSRTTVRGVAAVSSNGHSWVRNAQASSGSPMASTTSATSVQASPRPWATATPANSRRVGSRPRKCRSASARAAGAGRPSSRSAPLTCVLSRSTARPRARATNRSAGGSPASTRPVPSVSRPSSAFCRRVRRPSASRRGPRR